jgi:hypothetical protein
VTFELQDIFANHLTTMVFIYGSAGMLLANALGVLALARSLDKTRTGRALSRPV